jgi:hypothetical protein
MEMPARNIGCTAQTLWFVSQQLKNATAPIGWSSELNEPRAPTRERTLSRWKQVKQTIIEWRRRFRSRGELAGLDEMIGAIVFMAKRAKTLAQTAVLTALVSGMLIVNAAAESTMQNPSVYVAGKGKSCEEKPVSGYLDCFHASPDACQKHNKSVNLKCVANPDLAKSKQ